GGHRAGACRGARRVVPRRGQPATRRRAARPGPAPRGRRGREARRGPAHRSRVRDHRHPRELYAQRSTGRARGAGRKISDSVSSKTTGVIVGEEPGKSKLTKAEKAGVPLLNEADLLVLVG